MKKTILIVATLSIFNSVFAQKLVVESALSAIKQNNYDEAKMDIDKAMVFPGTKDKPKAIFAKAKIYYQMQLAKAPKYIESNPYREAASAIFHLSEVKSDYEKATVDQWIMQIAIWYYNDAVISFNNKKDADGIAWMQNVIKLRELEGGKRYEKFALKPMLDTIAARANMSIATSYMIDTNFAAAIPYLLRAKTNPITKNANIYNNLIECYSRTKNDKSLFEILDEGRKAFPDDKNLMNNEINFYARTGKMDELIKKLEDATIKQPNDSELFYFLGTQYLELAIPQTGTKPENSAQLIAKSEDAYQKALKLAPENPSYNYNYGLLFCRQGLEKNDKMNEVADRMNDKKSKNLKEDEKIYQQLKANRDEFLNKSLPFFEKSYNKLSASASTLKDNERNTYKNLLTALKVTYTLLNKTGKYNEVKEKLDDLNK